MTQVIKQHVQQARMFSQTELDARIEQGLADYQTGTWNGVSYSHPCADTAFFPSAALAFAHAKEMFAQGCELYSTLEPQVTGVGVMLSMTKLQAELDVLLSAEKERITQAYKQEVEEFNQAQVALLTEQLVAQELAKDQKKEQQRLQAIRDKAAQVAAEHIASQLKETK